MSKATEYWYPWTPSRYRADTMHLSAEEDGIYRRLIDHYMETKLPLPDDYQALARIAGSDVATIETAMEKKLRVLFSLTAGKLHLKKCDEILADQASRSQKYANNGKKGGRPKGTEIPPQKSNSKPNDKLQQSTRQDITVSSEDKSSSDNPQPPKTKSAYSSEFDQFWQAYPPHTSSKAVAAKAYAKAITNGADHATIRNSVTGYAAYIAATDTPVAHAATWLNQQRWTVDYDTARTHAANRGNRAIHRSDGSGAPRDTRDPAARAADEGERIIAARRASREAAQERSGRTGQPDHHALPDLREPGDLRGQGPDDGIPRPDVPTGAGGLPDRGDHHGIHPAPETEQHVTDAALHSQADRSVTGTIERSHVRPH